MLPTHIIRQLAAAAPCDPRPIRRLLRGQPIRPSIQERIVRAAAELGIVLPGSEVDETSAEAAGVETEPDLESLMSRSP